MTNPAIKMAGLNKNNKLRHQDGRAKQKQQTSPSRWQG